MGDLAHAAENDTDLHGDMDAAHWAERFASRFLIFRRETGAAVAALPFAMVDAGDLMLTWFAGAIMTGYDSAGTAAGMAASCASDGGRILPEYEFVLGQELEQAVYQALGAASVCWETMEHAGVFDSQRARQVGRELTGIIVQYARAYPHPGEPGYDARLHGKGAPTGETTWSGVTPSGEAIRVVDTGELPPAMEVTAVPTPDNDPAVGDPVIVRGRIKDIIEGVALVEVYRSYPPGGTVAVQCGALELDERGEASRCSGCGTPRAECRPTSAQPFLSCCEACRQADGDTHHQGSSPGSPESGVRAAPGG